MSKDTINLRDETKFEIEVFYNIFWVSANILGHTRYTNEDMKSIVLLSPSQKQSKINNLYEAIQLYQASKFKRIIDNVRIIEEETSNIWVYHKNGFDSVRTNEGCCAASSNWLSYILNDNYDEIGCFGFCQSDGNGHITNYIRHNGWYYFLDITMQGYDSAQIGIENGNLDDFYVNEVFGYIFKAKCFENYIDFCLNIYSNPPILFYKTNQSECVCIGTEYIWQADNEKNLYNLLQKSNKTLFYRNSVEILYSINNNAEFRDKTAVEPNWSKIKSFDFCTLSCQKV